MPSLQSSYIISC